MSEFTVSYEKTMGHEGLHSNDVRDLGGETWKGISRRNYPLWEGWGIIDIIKSNVFARDLNKALNADEELYEMVQAFYKAEFWDKLLLAQISEQEIADELFDTAINQGAVIAVHHLQQALNLLNNNQKHYSDLETDGKMGNETLKVYRAFMLTANFPGRSVDRNVKTLLKVMNGLQFSRYAEICANKPDQETFFYGWINRI